MNDEFLFGDDETTETVASPQLSPVPPWPVLIVDDEESVHRVTALALREVCFEGRPLALIHAHSAAQAREVLQSRQDIAVVLLDVVMETEHAGLELARYIRETLGNGDVRIVLRTGQPGQAPEQEVIAQYDINDYKDKTELTAQKLYTLMLSCLRSYRDIEILHKSRLGLQNVIRATRGIYEKHALTQFVEATLEQLANLLNLDDSAVYLYEVKAYRPVDGEFEMIYVGCDWKRAIRVRLDAVEPPIREMLGESIRNEANSFRDHQALLYCAGQKHVVLFYLSAPHELSKLDRHLIDMLTENLNIALDNIDLNDLLRETQEELIYRMGDMVENHSPETGQHVHRVSLYCERLAQLAGLGEEEAQVVKQSAPLHDLGKIGVPDRVLNKPGKLDDSEWVEMQGHAAYGHRMLAGSGLPMLDVAAEIALSHHEKWDGSGYPQGLAGEAIPISARIAAIADVFDALSSRRCYKDPWPTPRVVEYIRAQGGSGFDPRLVAVFIDNLAEFQAIQSRYPDA